MSTGWRDEAPRAHHRHVSTSWVRRVLVVLALGSIGFGAAACGGGDAQGRRDPDLSEVESQVAQLRLEVQSLRREIAALREEVATVTTTLPEDSTTSTTLLRS